MSTNPPLSVSVLSLLSSFRAFFGRMVMLEGGCRALLVHSVVSVVVMKSTEACFGITTKLKPLAQISLSELA